MTKILVPTDFSPNALKALDYAVEVSKASGATICLIHVLDITNAVMNDTIVLQGQPDKKLKAAAQQQLAILAKSARETTNNFVEEKLVTGLLTDGILEATRECHADMIIMGTLGDAALQEKIFGSITAKIIGKSSVPVLAIPLLYEWSAPSTILLSLQDFKESPSLLSPMIWFAGIFKAAIKVTIFSNEKNAQAVDYLQHKKDVELFCANMKHDHPNLEIDNQPIYGEHFEDAIKAHIKEKNVSLLVMMNHKRNFLESLFHRSITKKMSYHTDIPLLSIPVE